MTHYSDKVLKIFQSCNAMAEGHFLLSSGYHTNIYIQCAQVLQDPIMTEYLASLFDFPFRRDIIDTVLSPAMGGIIIGYEVARRHQCYMKFTERQHGKMTLRRGFTIAEGENILLIEDVISTGGSLRDIMHMPELQRANILGIGCLIDRRSETPHFDVPFLSLARIENAQYFLPEECALCAQHLPLENPGSRYI